MDTNRAIGVELVITIHREAEAAARAACVLLEQVRFPRVPIPLDFILGLAARLRFMKWEDNGWAHLVPPELRPARAEVMHFVKDALAGRPIEPAWSSQPSAFQKYLAALIFQTGWSGRMELRAPIAIHRAHRLTPVELATVADFLWKYRHAGRN